MADPGEGHEARIDALHALPLDEFTSARDELACRLRREGDADGGAEVKRLRRPSVAAWALGELTVGSAGQRQTAPSHPVQP